MDTEHVLISKSQNINAYDDISLLKPHHLLRPDNLITPISKFFAGWDNNRMLDHSSYHGIAHRSTLYSDSAFVSPEIHFWNGGS